MLANAPSSIILEPLQQRHARDLFLAGARPEIWKFLPIRGFSDQEGIRRWIEAAQESAAEGREEPFAIVERATGQAIGSTRFMDIRAEERALEIGWTWLAPTHQRTSANTEAKLLLLSEAFEERLTLRVAFYADAQNGRSRAALVRLGATYEGTLRMHRARAINGYARDSAAYSIIASEWPSIKARLEMKLRRPYPRLAIAR
jgi:RimJ/RimL family protein N-acetyltransferase